MRIGISICSNYPIEDPRLGARYMVERASTARQADLDSLFVGDHHVTPTNYYQNTAILGRMLAEWGNKPAGALYLLPLCTRNHCSSMRILDSESRNHCSSMRILDSESRNRSTSLLEHAYLGFGVTKSLLEPARRRQSARNLCSSMRIFYSESLRFFELCFVRLPMRRQAHMRI